MGTLPQEASFGGQQTHPPAMYPDARERHTDGIHLETLTDLGSMFPQLGLKSWLYD